MEDEKQIQQDEIQGQEDVYLERRIGRFRIRHIFLEKKDSGVAVIFKDMIILRAVSLYAEQCIEYVAYSPAFDVIPNGEIVPFYLVTVDDGKLRVERQREKGE